MQTNEEGIFAEMQKLAGQYAKAEADRAYLSEFRKSKKAILMREAETAKPGLSAANQQTYAYAHPDYLEVLVAYKHATEEAVLKRYELKIIEMKFEAWRSKNATARSEMNMR